MSSILNPALKGVQTVERREDENSAKQKCREEKKAKDLGRERASEHLFLHGTLHVALLIVAFVYAGSFSSSFAQLRQT